MAIGKTRKPTSASAVSRCLSAGGCAQYLDGGQLTVTTIGGRPVVIQQVPGSSFVGLAGDILRQQGYLAEVISLVNEDGTPKPAVFINGRFA